MVSPLKHYSKDPMKKGRGAGDYYKRSYEGNKKWYSKYSPEHDAMIHSSPNPRSGNAHYKHYGDATSHRYGKRRVRKWV